MAFDTKKWLVDELGFTAEDADAMLPKFADRSDKIEKGYLRQSDYSKSMNDLKKTQDELATANDRLTAEMAEWATLTEKEKRESGDLKAKLDASEEKAFRLNQKLTRLAEDNGIDPKTVLGDDPPPEKKKEPVFDASTLEANINNRIGGVAKYMMTLTAKIPRIAREHRELTGEDFDVDAFVSGIEADLAKNKTDNMDPIARWEAQYGIPAKRTEKSKTQHDAEIAAAEERGRVAARSEQMLPNQRPAGERESPVLRSVGPSKLQRPQPADRLAGARSALASGKYAPKSGAA